MAEQVYPENVSYRDHIDYPKQQFLH